MNHAIHHPNSIRWTFVSSDSFGTALQKTTLTSKIYYLYGIITTVQPFFSQADTECVMHAFITTKLDYCNSLLSGLPNKYISQLQMIQNAAARVLTKTGAHHTSLKITALVTC